MNSAVLSSMVQIKYSLSGILRRGQTVYGLAELINSAEIKGVLRVEVSGSTQSIFVVIDPSLVHLISEVKEAVDDLLEPHLLGCFRLQRPPS